MTDIKYFGVLENMQNNLGLFELDPLVQTPINSIKYLSKIAKLDSFHCPAVVDYLKNVFYITSPLDFSIIRHPDGMYSIRNDKSVTNDLSSFLYAQYPETKLLNNVPVLQIHLQYFFINKSDNVMMEVIDCPLISKNYTVVPGTYNISKWVRPTNFTFFMNKDVKEINFKQGDPLYAVRFQNCKNPNLIEITEDDQRRKILTEQQKALSIKKWYPNITLEKSYELFKRRFKTLW